MNVFDLYLMGDMDSINWNFRNAHFEKRLRQNGISLDYIQDKIFYEEPAYFESSRNNCYEVFFKTPDMDKFNEVKVIFACGRDSIDLVTVMPNG